MNPARFRWLATFIPNRAAHPSEAGRTEIAILREHTAVVIEVLTAQIHVLKGILPVFEELAFTGRLPDDLSYRDNPLADAVIGVGLEPMNAVAGGHGDG
ncbi:hypothetical protein [Telmatospirillum sp.]|uniref:hypothetical protein n=1 Tax=Telmatospirillum sp. TaxID=2079197 RepID=UPI002850D4ED|nr:hypothetical protein [Telmatospirillum sp.]MDR3439737.1 hypothetical protein [Telmatospirillum sp.]